MIVTSNLDIGYIVIYPYANSLVVLLVANMVLAVLLNNSAVAVAFTILEVCFINVTKLLVNLAHKAMFNVTGTLQDGAKAFEVKIISELGLVFDNAVEASKSTPIKRLFDELLMRQQPNHLVFSDGSRA